MLGCLVLAVAPAVFGKETTAQLYTRWHEVCLTGDTDAIDAQIAKYEARLALNPKDHLAEAFLGSACSLRARESFWGPTKLKFLKRGQALMDAAVGGAPEDARVRMVRAIGYYQVPKKFGMRPVSITDFEFLVPIAKEPKGRLEVEERQVILYYASLAFAEEGKAGAGELKALCHKLDPASKYGKLTR